MSNKIYFCGVSPSIESSQLTNIARDVKKNLYGDSNIESLNDDQLSALFLMIAYKLEKAGYRRTMYPFFTTSGKPDYSLQKYYDTMLLAIAFKKF